MGTILGYKESPGNRKTKYTHKRQKMTFFFITQKTKTKQHASKISTNGVNILPYTRETKR